MSIKTFQIKTHTDEEVKNDNRVDAQHLRQLYKEARMPHTEEDIRSLAEVFAGEEVHEGFWVTDDPKFLPRWEEFAQEHGLLLVA